MVDDLMVAWMYVDPYRLADGWGYDGCMEWWEDWSPDYLVEQADPTPPRYCLSECMHVGQYGTGAGWEDRGLIIFH